MLPPDKAGIRRLTYLLQHLRVSASIRSLTKEVVLPEDAMVDGMRVLHVEAWFVREEKEEGRWIVTGDQADELIKAGARDAE